MNYVFLLDFPHTKIFRIVILLSSNMLHSFILYVNLGPFQNLFWSIN